MIHPKFDALVDRLVYKMERSQTPVPGFMIGLSGTDSIVAYILCYKAAERLGISHKVYGINFVKQVPFLGWFACRILPWLHDNYSTLAVPYYLERYNDENRWARLHEEAKKFNCWTVGTMNATEKALGKYSLLSTAVSLQPIQTLYKSTILEICEALGVPRIAIDNARIPDCLCGRDEFAAENIELIDAALRYDPSLEDVSFERFNKVYAYINQCKSENGFRDRVPYTI
jgi:NH3-dependent NAD+ synthetase